MTEQDFTRAELQADIAFLLARMRAGTGISFGRAHWERWTGRSSNAIVAVAYGGEQDELPFDVSDYLACVRTVRRLPWHRKTPAVWAALRKARASVHEEIARWKERKRTEDG